MDVFKYTTANSILGHFFWFSNKGPKVRPKNSPSQILPLVAQVTVKKGTGRQSRNKPGSQTLYKRFGARKSGGNLLRLLSDGETEQILFTCLFPQKIWKKCFYN